MCDYPLGDASSVGIGGAMEASDRVEPAVGGPTGPAGRGDDLGDDQPDQEEQHRGLDVVGAIDLE